MCRCSSDLDCGGRPGAVGRRRRVEGTEGQKTGVHQTALVLQIGHLLLRCELCDGFFCGVSRFRRKCAVHPRSACPALLFEEHGHLPLPDRFGVRYLADHTVAVVAEVFYGGAVGPLELCLGGDAFSLDTATGARSGPVLATHGGRSRHSVVRL